MIILKIFNNNAIAAKESDKHQTNILIYFLNYKYMECIMRNKNFVEQYTHIFVDKQNFRL